MPEPKGCPRCGFIDFTGELSKCPHCVSMWEYISRMNAEYEKKQKAEEKENAEEKHRHDHL